MVQFFGLGLLISPHPNEIHRKIINLKNRRKFSGEFKFSEVRQNNLPLYIDLLNLFFDYSELRFHCVLYDKRNLDVPNQFKKGYDSAYNTFAARLIANSINTSEYIAILADDVSTKKDNNFERQIKEKIKKKARRNALFGICRLESHAVAEIQLVDVLLGTIAYAHKIKCGQIKANHDTGKLKLVKHLQNLLSVASISEPIDRKMRRYLRFTIEEY